MNCTCNKYNSFVNIKCLSHEDSRTLSTFAAQEYYSYPVPGQVYIGFAIFFFFFFFFFFDLVLRPFQDYFSSFDTGQSVGGAKTGEPREKPPYTPASRTWLVSHMARAGLEPTPVTAVR